MNPASTSTATTVTAGTSYGSIFCSHFLILTLHLSFWFINKLIDLRDLLRRERNRRKGVRSARTRREKNTEAPRVRRYSPPEEQLPWSAIRQMPYQSPDKVVGYKFAFFGFVLGGKCTKNIFAGTIKCSFFSKNLSTRAVGRFYTYLLYIRKRHDGSGTGCGDGQKKERLRKSETLLRNIDSPPRGRMPD